MGIRRPPRRGSFEAVNLDDVEKIRLWTRRQSTMRWMTALGALMIALTISPTACQAQAGETQVPATAWIEGLFARGLKQADALLVKFKERASHLGPDEKLRVLIIGDSLSDRYFHWSHHFRKNLQAGCGNGGPGNLWGTWRGNAQAGSLGPRTFRSKPRGPGVRAGAAGATPGLTSTGMASSWPLNPRMLLFASMPPAVDSRSLPAPARSRPSTAGKSTTSPRASPPGSTIKRSKWNRLIAGTSWTSV